MLQISTENMILILYIVMEAFDLFLKPGCQLSGKVVISSEKASLHKELLECT